MRPIVILLSLRRGRVQMRRLMWHISVPVRLRVGIGIGMDEAWPEVCGRRGARGRGGRAGGGDAFLRSAYTAHTGTFECHA